MKTVLLTGFEPFAGDARNPAAEIALTLAGRIIAGRRVVGAVLPCVFGESRRELRRLLDESRPELVICLGLACGRKEITPERVAINIDDARIADNAGRRPIDEPVVRGGPTAYWSGLPVKAIVTALRRRRVPASVSQTAGTFVCNHAFYALMHDLRGRRGVRGGFVHVPWPSDWPGHEGGAVPFQALVAGIETTVRVCLKTRRDRPVRGGAEE